MHILEQAARDVVAAWEKSDLAEKVRALNEVLAQIENDRTANQQAIKTARESLDGDNDQIDDEPFIAAADDGVWVSTWTFVPGTQLERTS